MPAINAPVVDDAYASFQAGQFSHANTHMRQSTHEGHKHKSRGCTWANSRPHRARQASPPAPGKTTSGYAACGRRVTAGSAGQALPC